MARPARLTAFRAVAGWVVAAPLLLCAGPVLAATADVVPGCVPVVARIVSVQGSVEVRRTGQQSWGTVKRLDTPVCQGDLIHAGPNSRAALVILPEKFVRLDQNSTLSIKVDGDETVVEFFQDQLKDSCGAGYFVTRFPRKFKVRTRYLNAAVEGTEFLVGLSCAATAVTVFEGKVSTEAPLSGGQTLLLTSGQTVSAGETEAPAVKVMVRPADAVQWALYYPPLSTPGAGASADQQCDQTAPEERGRCLTARAEERLRIGRLDDAQADIEALLAQGNASAEANALLAVISVAKNDASRAVQLAEQATRADVTSVRAWLALSYALQASFKLEDALAAAQRAADLAPRNAIAQARLAELFMSLGRTRSAERAARAAVDADPNQSRAHTVLGFVYLTKTDTGAAREAFLAAIERDSADPMPRLGLGLALIRSGQLEAGREQIEIAVVLDPTNALLRSYMGKAYYEENTAPRDELAATQFGLAKSLDQSDPTPWLYDAILKHTQNRPVEALEALERSIDLNDDRAVYRSRLLLDQDLAARAIGLSVLYTELGLNSRALAEASRSLSLDPANYSAHRFLAESYSFLPRHDVAQVSELLQSQLLQPLNLNPVPPRMSESDLLALTSGAPSDPSFNEYSSLFLRDGTRVQLNAIGGTQGSWGDDLIVSGLKGPLSLSAGQFHYETDGWRPNSDYTDDLYSAFAQLALTDRTSVQAEVRTRELEHGDITLRRTQPDVLPGFRRELDQDTARLGFRHRPSPTVDIIGSFIYQKRQELQQFDPTTMSTLFPPFGTITTTTSQKTDRQDRSVSGELQMLWRAPRVATVAGVGSAETDGTLSTLTTTTVVAPFPLPSGTISGTITRDTNSRQDNAYVYATAHLHPALDATLGVSYDYFEDFTVQREEINPKFGLVWSPTASTQVRAAAFRAVKRALIADQTIEPTQVAGFNQFFDDPNGTDSKRIGLGIDQRFSPRLFGGLEASQRWLNVPRFVGTPREEDQREQLYRASVGYMPWPQLALNAQVLLEDLEIDPVGLPDASRPTAITTTRLPLEARLFPNERWSFFLQLQNIWQEVETQNGLGQRSKATEDFSLVNAGLSFRLPQRRGTISLQVNNIFNQSFQYQDMNFRSSVPRLPEFLPERSAFVRVNLTFP